MTALRNLFDYQRFAGNARLGEMIRHAEEKYASRIDFEILEFVSAAGDPEMLQKQTDPSDK